MSLYILYINEGFFPKRYCVIDRSNNKMVFKTDSKSEVKRWVNSIGLKVLHYHVYDMMIEKYYLSMQVYLGFPDAECVI